MRNIINELNSIIKTLLVITVICGVIYRLFGNTTIIGHVMKIVGSISMGSWIIVSFLKDEIKDRLLQKEGWV